MTIRRAHWIPVVTALISRDGKLLVGRRPEDRSLPGLWEFPGGKIELGESPESALWRELNEELGIDAEIGGLAMATTHNYGQTGIILLFYHVHFWKGELRSKHHAELKWATPGDLRQWPLPDANRKILDRLLALIGEDRAHRLPL
jgi:8-oxo-dGTP diphosphatase